MIQNRYSQETSRGCGGCGSTTPFTPHSLCYGATHSPTYRHLVSLLYCRRQISVFVNDFALYFTFFKGYLVVYEDLKHRDMDTIKIPSPSAILDLPLSPSLSRRVTASPGIATSLEAANHVSGVITTNGTHRPKQSKSRNG